MTAKRFAQHLAELEGVETPATVIRSFWGGDAEAWAYTHSRAILTEGGHDQFPYQFATTDPRHPLDLTMYCEGDLTRYIFATTEDRDAAAEAYTQTPAERVAEYITESYSHRHYAADPATLAEVAQAVCNWTADHYSGEREPDEDRTAEALELYRGKFATPGAFAMEEADAWDVGQPKEWRRGEGEGTPLPDWIAEAVTINWEQAAAALDFSDYAGHYFDVSN